MNEYELSMFLPDLSPTSYQASCIECSCCYCVLGRQRDFLEQRSGVEDEAYSKFNGEHNSKHRCLFLPKLHPELNYIERIWGRMKYDTRLHCDTKFDIPWCATLQRQWAKTTTYLLQWFDGFRSGKDIITDHEWVEKHRAHRSHSKNKDASSVDIGLDARRPAGESILRIESSASRSSEYGYFTDSGRWWGLRRVACSGKGPILDSVDIEDNLDDLFDIDNE